MNKPTHSSREQRFRAMARYAAMAIVFGIALYGAWQRLGEEPVAPRGNVPATSRGDKDAPAVKDAPSVKSVREIRKSPAVTEPRSSPDQREAASSRTATLELQAVVTNQTIRDEDGDVIYRGDIDLSDTLDRIERGDRIDHFPNDGDPFENRERRLPRKNSSYYREWVHPTPGISGPGPQRVVTGRDGEYWYTPDHYRRFIPLHE